MKDKLINSLIVFIIFIGTNFINNYVIFYHIYDQLNSKQKLAYFYNHTLNKISLKYNWIKTVIINPCIKILYMAICVLLSSYNKPNTTQFAGTALPTLDTQFVDTFITDNYLTNTCVTNNTLLNDIITNYPSSPSLSLPLLSPPPPLLSPTTSYVTTPSKQDLIDNNSTPSNNSSNNSSNDSIDDYFIISSLLSNNITTIQQDDTININDIQFDTQIENISELLSRNKIHSSSLSTSTDIQPIIIKTGKRKKSNTNINDANINKQHDTA